MATEENPQANLGDNPSDQEHFEVLLTEEEDNRENPEGGTSAAGRGAADDATEEELLPGVWQGSTITEEDILRLRQRRQILDGVLTRVPPIGEIEPHPEDGEYVVFYAHFDRGFALPVSNFTRFTMSQFQVQPHHLPVNAILAMSCVAACLEAYVGVRATKQIWEKYFQFAC